MSPDDGVARSAERIAASGRRPRIAVLLGSGWQPFADCVRSATHLPYAQPRFGTPCAANQPQQRSAPAARPMSMMPGGDGMMTMTPHGEDHDD